MDKYSVDGLEYFNGDLQLMTVKKEKQQVYWKKAAAMRRNKKAEDCPFGSGKNDVPSGIVLEFWPSIRNMEQSGSIY